MLLATADFASLPGAVTPDFTLPDGFLFSPDGIVNYIGANSLTYDCLPADGTLSLHCDANNGVRCTATSVGVKFADELRGRDWFHRCGWQRLHGYRQRRSL